MFRIRYIAAITFDVVTTTFVEGRFVTENIPRAAVIGKMAQAVDVVEDGLDLIVQFNENERAVIPAHKVEVHQWEPDRTIQSSRCCNHG